jgi:hypothetical protein
VLEHELFLINADSPLRTLPEDLAPRQRAWFEAARYCLEIADEAYGRLLAELAVVGARKDSEATDVAGESLTLPADELPVSSIFASTWTIVDSVWRFHLLLNATPFRPPEEGEHGETRDAWREFRNLRKALTSETGPLKKMRDGFQHIDERTATLGEQKVPVWGALSWLTTSDGERFWLTKIAAGTPHTSHTLEFPRGKPQASLYPAHEIGLEAFGEQVSISTLLRRVKALVEHMEAVIGPQFEGRPTGPRSVIMTVEFGFQLAAKPSNG